MKTFNPYQPPTSFAFKNMTDAILHYILAVCSVECTRFLAYTRSHPSQKDNNMRTYLNAYTVANWANGRIDQSVWLYREKGAKVYLENWAKAMIEFSSFFREKNIGNPTEFLSDHGYIFWDETKQSWVPKMEAVEKLQPTTQAVEREDV